LNHRSHRATRPASAALVQRGEHVIHRRSGGLGQRIQAEVCPEDGGRDDELRTAHTSRSSRARKASRTAPGSSASAAQVQLDRAGRDFLSEPALADARLASDEHPEQPPGTDHRSTVTLLNVGHSTSGWAARPLITSGELRILGTYA
jgi:hypothetical protein